MSGFLSNKLTPWIDPRVKTVKVAEVEAYIRAHGWEEIPSPRPQARLFKGPPADDGQPLIMVVPAGEHYSDYVQRIIDIVTGLSMVEDRYAVEVLNDVLEAGRVGRNGNGQRASAEAAEKQPS